MLNKTIFILLLTFISKTIFAQHIHYPDKPSVHGMMLMGTETIYASHLPMFHSPHDYQIILAIAISDSDKIKYINDKVTHPGELIYTLEPEVFILPEMVNYTKKFKASIYRGHFERGGIKIIENIPVTIQQIIYYKQFDKGTLRPEQLEYILFGNKKEQFLVHRITVKPDFDENIAVSVADTAILKSLETQNFTMFQFNEKDNRKPFSWSSTEAVVKEGGAKLTFQFHKTLYLEFSDLD